MKTPPIYLALPPLIWARSSRATSNATITKDLITIPTSCIYGHNTTWLHNMALSHQGECFAPRSYYCMSLQQNIFGTLKTIGAGDYHRAPIVADGNDKVISKSTIERSEDCAPPWRVVYNDSTGHSEKRNCSCAGRLKGEQNDKNAAPPREHFVSLREHEFPIPTPASFEVDSENSDGYYDILVYQIK
ncbi:uncharacterized protein LY89DRAFT_686480 [Mollisia scopiformis]|uniref:Uncharacterized protein n=1 Tax=Mollisia scopiformis TaxID=149040 RepID=A0A194X3U1_MOLSC|nr:uncharacterized protein LY89DRAFT_686480 [Mollisia scopiformis]KUJ14850.1 hypothetical protein LY89DRAFT_686480 [Mollisia scopiformis]